MEASGLTFADQKIGDVVGKDTDGDTIPDWEESLWGTDPTKKDTDGDGVDDAKAIAKLQAEKEASGNITEPVNSENGDTPTQTDKFSRELFSTVTTLNQQGPITGEAADKLGGSLADQIQNPAIRKTYLKTDLKIETGNNQAVYQTYATNFATLYKNNPINGNVLDILQEFSESGDEPDASILDKLDPIVKNLNAIITGMTTMATPTDIADAHLGVINALERVSENLSDIQLYGTDTIVAMGALGKYDENADLVDSASAKLGAIIKTKLKY